MLHVLLLIALCCLPALVLLPLRILDREPRNEIAQEQEDAPRRDPMEIRPGVTGGTCGHGGITCHFA